MCGGPGSAAGGGGRVPEPGAVVAVEVKGAGMRKVDVVLNRRIKREPSPAFRRGGLLVWRRFGTIRSISSHRGHRRKPLLVSSISITGSSLTNGNALEITSPTNALFVQRHGISFMD